MLVEGQTYQFYNVGHGKCLNATRDRQYGFHSMKDCSTTDSDQSFVKNGDKLKHVSSGYCAVVANNDAWAGNNGRIKLVDCSSNDDRWKWSYGDETRELTTPAWSTLCMDAYGGDNVKALSCSTHPNQTWVTLSDKLQCDALGIPPADCTSTLLKDTLTKWDRYKLTEAEKKKDLIDNYTKACDRRNLPECTKPISDGVGAKCTLYGLDDQSASAAPEKRCTLENVNVYDDCVTMGMAPADCSVAKRNALLTSCQNTGTILSSGRAATSCNQPAIDKLMADCKLYGIAEANCTQSSLQDALAQKGVKDNEAALAASLEESKEAAAQRFADTVNLVNSVGLSSATATVAAATPSGTQPGTSATPMSFLLAMLSDPAIIVIITVFVIFSVCSSVLVV